MNKLITFLLLAMILLSLFSLPQALCFSTGYESFADPAGNWFGYLEYLPIVPYDPLQPTASEEFAIRYHLVQNPFVKLPVKYVPGGYLIAVYFWDECGNSSWPCWKRWYPISMEQNGLIVSWSLSASIDGEQVKLGLAASIEVPLIHTVQTNLSEYPFTPPVPPFNDKEYMHMGALEIVYNCNPNWGPVSIEGAGVLGVPNDFAQPHDGHHTEILVEVWSFWCGYVYQAHVTDAWSYTFIRIGDDVPSDTDCWLKVQEGTTNFSIRLLGDFNEDNEVNILDLVILAGHFGHTVPPDDPIYDLNDDGKINILDLVREAGHFGETFVPEGNSSGSSSSSGLTMTEILTEGTTAISIQPSTITVYKHETFTVNITITDVVGMYGWELKLYWNSALLNCTNAQVYAPEIWGNNTFTAGLGIENGYNATHGRYWKALTALNPMSSFNGTTTAVTLTFQALTTGSTTLTLQDTIICDINATEINHTTADGSVTVAPRERFMRGDTHTINGLTAYKLGTSQSTVAKSFSQTEHELGEPAYWGIKVWKRSQGGTETSLTSDIVAQVSRTSQGQGIQSAAWNCPLTNLSTTDSIVVRVYQKIGTSAWQLAGTFTTEQLGATQLDSSIWQIYYYTKLAFIFLPKQGIEDTKATFYWGTATYNSRILNFEHY
jgi:hypothetical protein